MRKSKLSILAVAIGVLLTASQIYSQWQFVGFVTGYDATLTPSIAVYDTNKVVTAGSGPGNVAWMHRSTNSGVTFTAIPTAGITLDLFCVWARDDNTIYAGDGGGAAGIGGNAHVWKTTNAGTSWTAILSTGGTLGFINGVVFSKINPQVGVCQSDPPPGSGAYWMAKTTDGGTTWVVENPTSSGSQSAQNSVICIDANFYGFGCNTVAKVGITTNGGTLWNYQTLVGAGGTFISGYAYNSDKLNGVATGNTLASTISRTTNGGTTWTSQSVGTGITGFSTLKWVHGTNIVYLSGTVGAAGCIKRSSDGGVTWTTMTTQGITNISSMEYYKAPGGGIYLYALSTDGSIIRYVDNSVLGIDPNNNSVPSTYSLEQNYPNPFNPTTTIKYAVPVASNVSIKIYNSLGEVVRTVVDKYHTTGNYTESVSMDGLSSGIYYYTMTAGDFKESKKMMLIK